MESSLVEFIVFAEAPADQQIACELADRVLCEEEDSPTWLEAYLLDSISTTARTETPHPGSCADTRYGYATGTTQRYGCGTG